MLSSNKNYNKIKIGEKNFLGIIFWYMYFYKKLYNFNFFNLFLIKQTYINFFNLFILHYRIILLNKVIKKYYNYFYNCFKLSLNKNKYFYFYFKCFLLKYNYDMYTKFKSYIFFRLKRLNRKIKALVKRKKIKKVKNFGILHITFKKRNIFFNLSSFKSKTLFLTTVRKEGFIGRRRREYISIYSTIRIIKKKFKRYKLKKLAVLYSG